MPTWHTWVWHTPNPRVPGRRKLERLVISNLGTSMLGFLAYLRLEGWPLPWFARGRFPSRFRLFRGLFQDVSFQGCDWQQPQAKNRLGWVAVVS